MLDSERRFKIKLPFHLAKILQGRHFVVDGPKNIKLLADISFENSLQNIVFPSLLLFLRACYYVDLDGIQWNEVAAPTARNFNNSSSLYINFSNMINLCPNIWFIKNSKCQQYFFEKRSRQKKSQIFQIFKGPLFRNGWPYLYECSCVLRDFCWLSKKCGFAAFPAKFNCL